MFEDIVLKKKKIIRDTTKFFKKTVLIISAIDLVL